MSDSSPKLRSPLAAYGPIVACIVVIGVALTVLFSLGSSASLGQESATPAPKIAPTPVDTKTMQKMMGYGDPDEVRAEVLRLIKKRGMSWFDLKPEEQSKLNLMTRNSGRDTFEGVVNAERAKNK